MNLHLGIRTKLLIAILLLLVISFVVLLCTTIVSVDNFVAKQIDSELNEHLGYLQNQFYARAETIRDSLLQPVSSPPVQMHILARDRLWLDDAIHRWETILPYVDLLTIVDARKKALARLNGAEPEGSFALSDLLDRAFREKKPVITTEIVPRKALAHEAGPAWVPVQLVNGAAMMITVVVPVLTEKGEMIGAVVAGDVLNGDQNLPVQYQRLFSDEGLISVIQYDTTIVSSNRHELLNGTRLDPEVLQELKSGHQCSGKMASGGVPYRTAFVPILSGQGSFIGALSVAISVNEYRNIRRETERNILTAATLATLLTFCIAFVVSRKLSEPLRRLAGGVRMIEAGDIPQQVEVSSEDEVGQLARSFNSMVRTLGERNNTIEAKTEALQQLNELLEKKVEDRTAQLQMEMGMLEAILTCMAEGMVVIDRDSKVIRFNPAAQKIFAMSLQRVIGRTLTQLEGQEGFAELALLTGAAASGTAAVSEGETTISVKGKKLQVSVSQLVDRGGASAGVVMSLRDVTAEEEIDRMKTDFISTVSHELKTPLTSIIGALQFITNKGKWLTSTERELINVCMRNAERLTRLISDILDISKIEAGRVEFKLKPQSVSELVGTAIEEIKGFALGRDKTVINTTPTDLPLVYGDHDRLVQVLTNLLSNAVKFSPEQKVVVVSAARTGDFVTISVTDSGKPILMSDRDKLFRKFQQIEREDMGSRGGTGLGLAICKEIVERHHGRIYYETSSSGGSVFSFTVMIYEERHAE